MGKSEFSVLFIEMRKIIYAGQCKEDYFQNKMYEIETLCE